MTISELRAKLQAHPQASVYCRRANQVWEDRKVFYPLGAVVNVDKKRMTFSYGSGTPYQANQLDGLLSACPNDFSVPKIGSADLMLSLGGGKQIYIEYTNPSFED